MELIARRVILELEGEEGFKHLEEYADGDTERGKALRKAICEKFQFSTLDFQSLEGVIEAIGLPVASVEGDEENIKITTAMDIIIAEEIIRRRGA